MARVQIDRCFPDGDVLSITVAVSESYPDAVAEARVNCRALYADALEITLADVELTATETADTDPDVI